MTDLTTAAKKKCALAFEIAVKNCIQKPVKGQKTRKVNISEKDSQTMYAFYLKHVKDDRNEALAQIGLASRRAAGSGAVLSIGIFVLAAAFMFALVFQNAWGPLFAVTAGGLAAYLFWNRRRAAQKLWAARKTFKRGTEEALEKMCLVLASSPLKFANLAFAGGAAALALVFAYKMITERF